MYLARSILTSAGSIECHICGTLESYMTISLASSYKIVFSELNFNIISSDFNMVTITIQGTIKYFKIYSLINACLISSDFHKNPTNTTPFKFSKTLLEYHLFTVLWQFWVYRSDSVIPTHTFILFQLLFSYSLPQALSRVSHSSL